MNDKKYVSGFDLMKLVGCIAVAFSHVVGFGFIDELLGYNVVSYFWQLISVFFFVSGHLLYISITSKKDRFKYVASYVAKYYMFYFIIHLVMYSFHYINIYIKSSVFMYKDFAYFMITLPLRDTYLVYLWFVPALLVGVIISCFIFSRKNTKNRIALSLILFVILVSLVIVFKESSFKSFFTKVFLGTVSVFAGMLASKHMSKLEKIKTWNFLIISALLLIIEISFSRFFTVSFVGFSFAKFFLSFTIYLFLYRIKFNGLRKYHKKIVVFSGIMYFLHVPQNMLLGNVINNEIIIFLIITLFNAGLTMLICLRKNNELQ